MSRNRGGVGGYRGHRSIGDVLKWVAIVLAVLVALVLAGLFFGQRYIVYTDSGIRLELPIFIRERPASSAVDPNRLNVGEETEDGEQNPDGSAPQPSTPAEQTTAYHRAVELPISAILDGTAAQQLAQAGGDVLVVEMKGREGRLNWVSEEHNAILVESNSTVPGINEKLTAWNQGDVYTVARVSCFADNTAPYAKMAFGLRSGKGNWRSPDGKRWLDPMNGEAQAYLAGLCGELAALGFDEILLEYPACPTEGALNQINWSGSDQEGAVSGPGGFLDQVKQAVAAKGAKLSVRTELEVLDGQKPGGGLTAAGLEQYVDRIWLPAGGENPVQRMTEAGLTNAAQRLVSITETLRDAPNSDQAVIPPNPVS